MKKFIAGIWEKFKNRFFRKDFPIENKLSHLIMICTVVGCLVAFMMSLFVNRDLFASIIIFVALAVVVLCLYIAAWKNKHKLAAIMVVILVDGIIFPFMFVFCGGIRSGMVCWLLVGLTFPFLVLTGKLSIICFLGAFVVLGGIYVLEYYNLIPFFDVATLTEFGWMEDTVQSMALVAIVFGVIFKFQARIFTDQANELKERERQLKESMEKLEHASKAKSDFLANMSHEIRTPINAIMGMNEIILRDCEDKDVIQNSVNIRNASENLLSIVNDILDFSKIEAGKLEIIPTEYKLSSIVVDCYNLINMRAFNKGLRFSVINDPDIPENLYGDEFRIRQIVTNLLTNAVKYTKEGSVELHITYEKAEQISDGKNDGNTGDTREKTSDKIGDKNVIIKFEIKDTGVGISDENKALLFKSFQRLDEKNNRSIEGTGLGLTISARLAEAMGGAISVDSVLGEGSVFTATIPQKVMGEETIGDFSTRLNNVAADNGKKEQREVFTLPGAKLLVVDDVKMNLNVIRGLLKNSQMEITLALSGKEMLELSETKKYDLILLDHMMPEMDGVEALSQLKKRKNINFDTPVVALTANAIKGAEEEYLAQGFDAYLSKPVHGIDLENMIKSFLVKE